MDGIIIINKPQAFTSFDAVAVIRKITKQKKVGHCGTLDPNATGVLPVLLGNATKAQDIIPNHDKEYIAEFKFGLSTDTLDVWGTVLKEEKSAVTQEDIKKALPLFTGEILQVPPMYSAIKKDGKKLCDLARKGIQVERTARKIKIYDFELLAFNETEQTGKIKVACSKGTYIRTLIEDMANALGTIGIMTSLVRTYACGYTLENAIELNYLKTLSEEEIQKNILKTDTAFKQYKKICVTQKQAVRFTNGGELALARIRGLDNFNQGERICVYDENKAFLGLGIVKESDLKIFKLFL